ncbi:hypothetical protein [Streptomyces aurantiogriseus]|uniref:Uncharacterized protein n=1 Tax=Streptomyces aurantiogriseus TaxID=66870 RepID=A0A918CLK3_9ACTN|nr:hypothetical protein [Streptomyces aurantiogriseus]GGR29100.1 hypothetical protein GCM10010251_51650 [Streptomyces aurantiogriseus]
MSGDQYGLHNQGYFVPPMPPAPPPAPADGARAVAVAVLNLSGLGLGYALVRRWGLMALCWIATAALLLVALPADPDGVPGFALAVYAVFLAAAAAHGARVGLRTRLAWPRQAPIALALGLVLLAAPAGGVVLYDDARDEAVEQMLLDRLDQADRLVAKSGKQTFSLGKDGYREALSLYEDLSADHSGSRAADRVPARMRTFYSTVGAAYAQGDHCEAIEPLTYLRTVPKSMPATDLGELESWPDDRLATSLYECASQDLASGGSTWTERFGELLTDFPESEQAAKVEPALGAAVTRAAKDLRGNEPCTAVERLRGLASKIDGLPGEEAGVDDALAKDAGRATANADSGTYLCGVDQYQDGEFEAAQTTMNEFVKANRNHKNRARAEKIAIAAEIAQTVPAAGKSLPTTRTGGSISVTVQNDSPDDITVLYTGPVTGRFTLKGCGSCTTYSFSSTLSPSFEPCSDSGKNYPERTISLPPGTTYFVHKPNNSLSSPASDTAKLQSGYIYTECAYATQTLGSGL